MPPTNQTLNGLRVEIHGHQGVDVSGMTDVTQYVSAISITHSVAPPWDVMNITLLIPHHSLDLILPGDRLTGGHAKIHTGAWVVVRAGAPTGDPNTGHPAIGFGCIENMSFGFQDIAGIGRVPVQGTTPVQLQCGSWLTAAGRSNIRIAITNEETSQGGVQDATTWFPVIVEAIKNSTSSDLGFALTQLWKMTAQVEVPDTILSVGGAAQTFGNQVPVVYDSTLADRYAPSRNGATLPVRGQGFLNLPTIQPECDLWQWLGATFVPDANLVELFPSLEFPQLQAMGPKDAKYVPVDKMVAAEGTTATSNNQGSTSGADSTNTTLQPNPVDQRGNSTNPYNTTGVSRNHLTSLGKALGGSNVVLMYRYRPFLMHPINQANWGSPTKSEKIGVNQAVVHPNHFGAAQEWYAVHADEAISFQASFSESSRVNLTFARPTMIQTGSLRPYTQFGKVVKPRPQDFPRYGLRAYEPMWPFIPEGKYVDKDEARLKLQSAQNMSGPVNLGEDLLADLEAMNELVWALCGGAERFAHATLVTRSKPWCRAGHWISGNLGYVADKASTLQHWTGYIESVTHTFNVDSQGRWHSGSSFSLSRVSFSVGASRHYTPVANPEKPLAGSDAKNAPKPDKSIVKEPEAKPDKQAGKKPTREEKRLHDRYDYKTTSKVAARLLKGPRPTTFHDKHYPPGSAKQIELFTAAAKAVGLPESWAKDKDVLYILTRESNGWVGIPNASWVKWYKLNGYPQMTFGKMVASPELWPLVWQVLKDCNAVPSFTKIGSHASGLGQIQPYNSIISYYPDGLSGVGDPFNEAVGMLLYIDRIRQDPPHARDFWDKHKWY